jgi:hypothetical protein
LDQAKVNQVIKAFFSSLKIEEDKTLETGLSHNTTVQVLESATLQLVTENPARFESYVKFFEFGVMYLQDETDELPEVEKIG